MGVTLTCQLLKFNLTIHTHKVDSDPRHEGSETLEKSERRESSSSCIPLVSVMTLKSSRVICIQELYANHGHSENANRHQIAALQCAADTLRPKFHGRGLDSSR